MNINLSKILTRLSQLFVRYFKIVLIVVIALWLLLGYTLLIQPKWNEVKETGLFDYNNEKQLKVEKEKYLADLKKSLEEFDKINQADIEKIAKIIPSEKGLADLFVVMEDLIKKSGLALDSISFSEGQSLNQTTAKTAASSTKEAQAKDTAVAKNINILNIALSVSGGREYKDLKVLLDNIEKEQRIMDIESITFNPPADSSAAQEMNFGLNLITYYFKEE